MSITNTEIVRLAKLLLASEAAQSPDHPDHSRAIKLDDEADREFANLDMYDSALVVMARMLFSGYHYYVNGSDPDNKTRVRVRRVHRRNGEVCRSMGNPHPTCERRATDAAGFPPRGKLDD